MVIVKPNLRSETAPLNPDNRAAMAAMGAFNEELVKAGVMLACDGLKSSSAGARVKFSGTKRTVVDGPFSETKELVGGYWIWQVKNLDEAIEWARRCPNPGDGEECELELRPIAGPEDFAGIDPSGELYEQEQKLRAQFESQPKK
jgi:hypothetical protein